MIDKLIFIGFGAVAKSLMDLFNKEKLFKSIKTIIIEPLDIPEWIYRGRKIYHIKEKLNKDNINKLLKKINKNTLIIDLSVETDGLLIIKKVIQKECMYINTSLEEDYTNTKTKKLQTYKEIKKHTLFYRQNLLNNMVKDFYINNHHRSGNESGSL